MIISNDQAFTEAFAVALNSRRDELKAQAQPEQCKHGLALRTCAICCGSARTRKHKVKDAPVRKTRKHAAPPAWHEDARAEVPSESEMHLHYIASLYDTVADAQDDFNAMLSNYRAEYRERFMDCCEFLGLV